MPYYNYQCSHCQHIFEKKFSIADRNIPESEPCPNCQSKNTVKQHISTSNWLYLDPSQTGKQKPNEDWTSFLKMMKKNNPGSDFNTFR